MPAQQPLCQPSAHMRSHSDVAVVDCAFQLLESVERLIAGQSDDFVHNGQQMVRISARRVDLNALAIGLQSQGYAVSIRKAVGGGSGGECLKNLRHSFLRCSMPGEIVSLDGRIRLLLLGCLCSLRWHVLGEQLDLYGHVLEWEQCRLCCG